MSKLLDIRNHDRDSAGLRYVYPVVSRRAGGVSVGINLNVNNACNWRCIYCQVPNLVIGGPPPVDMVLLEQELRGFFAELLYGDFMQQRVPTGMRRISDIAISGNGEPTSAREFSQVVALIGRLRAELKLDASIKTVLITNGSLMHREGVRAALIEMAGCNGEVWFKLDRATEEGMRRVNNTNLQIEQVIDNLRLCTSLCPTWLQTCWFDLEGGDGAAEQSSYLKLVGDLLARSIPVRGVHIYGVMRSSMQSESARIIGISDAQMRNFAQSVRGLGLPVRLDGVEVA